MMENRLPHLQPDYVFAIVRKPEGWHPAYVDDLPPGGEVVSAQYVASYEEARDDLLRCNQLAMRRQLKFWAVIHCPGGSF